MAAYGPDETAVILVVTTWNIISPGDTSESYCAYANAHVISHRYPADESLPSIGIPAHPSSPPAPAGWQMAELQFGCPVFGNRRGL